MVITSSYVYIIASQILQDVSKYFDLHKLDNSVRASSVAAGFLKVLMSAYRALSFTMLTVFLVSCGGGSSGGSENPSITDLSNVPSNVSGVAQKGPYRGLATVIATRIDSDGTLTGDTVSGKTVQDGEYSLELPWSDPTEIVVNGLYFDELTTATSTQSLALSVVYSPLDTTKVNVNLFTHLESGRILNLMRSGSTYNDAKTQALAEIRQQFNFDKRVLISPYQLNLIDARSGAASDSANLLLFSLAYLPDPASISAVPTSRNNSDLELIKEDFVDDGQINGSIASISLNVFNEIAAVATTLLPNYPGFPVPLYSIVRDTLVTEGYINAPTINDLMSLVQNQTTSTSLHTHPDDAQLVSMIAPMDDLTPAWVSGKKITIYGKKDTQGLALTADSIDIVDSATGGSTNVNIRPDGSIYITNPVGDRYNVSAVSGDTADVTVLTADGFLSTVRIDNLSSQLNSNRISASKISPSTQSLIDQGVYKSVQLSTSTSLSRELSVAALMQPATAAVNVTKCDQPYDDAYVAFGLAGEFDGAQSRTFLTQLATPGSGRFKATLPIDSTDSIGPEVQQACDWVVDSMVGFCAVMNGAPASPGGLADLMIEGGGCAVLSISTTLAAPPSFAACTAVFASSKIGCTVLDKQSCASGGNLFKALRSDGYSLVAMVEDYEDLGRENVKVSGKVVRTTDTTIPDFNISLGVDKSIESLEVSTLVNPPFGVEYDVTANLACVPQGTPVNMNFFGPNNRKFSVASTVSSNGQATFTIPADPLNGVRDLIQIHVDDSDPNTTLIKTLSIFNPPLVSGSTETLAVDSTTISSNLNAKGADSFQIKSHPSYGNVILDITTGLYTYNLTIPPLTTLDSFTFSASNEAGESIEAEVIIQFQSIVTEPPVNDNQCLSSHRNSCELAILGEFKYRFVSTTAFNFTCYEASTVPETKGTCWYVNHLETDADGLCVSSLDAGNYSTWTSSECAP